MAIIKINDLPQTDNVTSDDFLVIMDDPSGAQVTKKVSFSQIVNAIDSGSFGGTGDITFNGSTISTANPDQNMTLTTNGDGDIYLGDDDQYVKIEKDGGNVIISTDSNNNHWTFGSDSTLTFPNNTTQSTASVNAALQWTVNHTLADGTRYLANDVVYDGGSLYKANFDNESLPVTNTTYWTNIGSGYRLNLDGRDIPNIPYPVNDIIQGSNITVTEVNGAFTLDGPTAVQESASVITTVFNQTGSIIPKFTAIYVNGGQGDTPTISLAQANTESTSSKTYGITAEAINHMSTGKVIVFGALTGINTDQFNPTAPTGNVNGTTLWLSPSVAGGFTTTKPSAPNHMVAMGIIVRTHQNAGVVEVRVQNGYELEELHNVSVTGVTDKQLLRYNFTTELWEPYSFNINDIDFTTVPSIDPLVPGRLWRDAANGNVLKVSWGAEPTECPSGKLTFEGWYCCPDNINEAPTAGDCP